MITKTVTVTDAGGFHLRPAGLLAKIARDCGCEVTIIYNENSIPAKKMMAIMSAGIPSGAELQLTFDGENELGASETVVAFFEGGMVG